MSESPPPPRVRPAGAWVWAVVSAAVVVGALALWPRSPPRRLAVGTEYEKYNTVDPKRIIYGRVLRIDTRMRTVHSVATGPGDRIYAGGDREIRIYAPDGAHERTIPCPGAPRCLAAAADGTLYAGLGDHIVVLGPEGAHKAAWPAPDARSRITSLAASGGEVYAADYGLRVVLHYRADGRLLGRIEAKDPNREAGGFRVPPSACFDCAAGGGGLVHVAHTGRLRVESYDRNGDLLSYWGEPSFELEGFSGCCNPAHIAALPDGGIVTSEKGLSRVKVYGPDGAFLGAVAGPRELGTDPRGRDVAADSKGRVVVLDPLTRTILVFERKPKGAGR